MTSGSLRLLAIDLGAESGRAVVGRFDGDRLRVEEAHRFANVPVRLGGTLYWDFLRIFGDVVTGMGRAVAAGSLASVGVDTWGVDFGLLDRSGRLLANPVHYRDGRTQGMIQRATQCVPREAIYAATGIQFMEINTLYQLLSMVEAADPNLESAERLLLVPDLINHFLCGSLVSEYTNATTTQCYHARGGGWASDLLTPLGIPERLFPEVVPPGTLLGELVPAVAEAVGQAGLRVVAPGTHDTASAVAAVPLPPTGTTVFLSSGTWSLLGIEVDRPVISEAALAANLTNEGGVAGTIRLLKNVMGLWLVQEARRALGDRRREAPPSYEELTGLAEQAQPFTAFIDPDDQRFLRPGPTGLSAAVEAVCRETQQPPPADPGTLVRVLLESLALKYAWVTRQLEAVTGRSVAAIHVVGGGAHNSLLCRLTAAAAGRPVLAGPSEATAIGNLVVQAIALGELGSLAEARELVARSFPVRQYEPEGDWREARARFERLVGGRVFDTAGR